MDKRVGVGLSFRNAFPHLYPVQQYNPIKLEDSQYGVARMIAEGHSNDSISKKRKVLRKRVQNQMHSISIMARDQFPSGYNLRVQIANLFNNGAFYSESNNSYRY